MCHSFLEKPSFLVTYSIMYTFPFTVFSYSPDMIFFSSFRFMGLYLLGEGDELSCVANVSYNGGGGEEVI